MAKFDLEQLEQLMSVMERKHTQNAVPVVSVPQDRDSFATFTNGLRLNWPILASLMVALLWVFTTNAENDNTNALQDRQITTNTDNIETLTANLLSFQSEMRDQAKINDKANGNILSAIELIQKDIEAIKSHK